MTTYESKVKAVAATPEQIFSVVSNMQNLQVLKDRIPADKIQDFTTTATTCSCRVNPFGTVEIAIVDATPSSTVKYGTRQSPMDFNAWIQIKEIEPGKSAIKLTLKIELNFMIKAMVDKYLSSGIDKAADVLVRLPYSQIANKRG